MKMNNPDYKVKVHGRKFPQMTS